MATRGPADCDDGERKAASGIVGSAHGSVDGDVGREADAERAASGAAGAGLDFLEIPLVDPGAFDVASTLAMLERHGLDCTCSVGLPHDAHAPDAPEKAAAFLEEAVEVAAALGSDV